MKKAGIFLADGFEEIEGLTVVDLLRRAGVEVITISVTEHKKITGAHDIKLYADAMFDDVDFETLDAVILPGGMPGTTHLDAHEGVHKQIRAFFEKGKLVAAICAAPGVLGHEGLLEGKKATCYPGCETNLTGAEYTKAQVEMDGNIITANGPGAAVLFSLKIISSLLNEEKAAEVKADIVYR